jgi:DNA (cytosine-5)-methyltransferase 1
MRVVDLFAGCGGLSKGFELAKFELSLAIEHWDAARDVYALNFKHPVISLDLSNIVDAVSVVSEAKPDIIIGGPPCQDFSFAGGRIEGEKAKLTVSFVEIVTSVRPQWFVIENVMGLSTSETWCKARQMLVEAGYGITEQVLNAAFYGVPQNRKRFFAIGCLGEKDNFLLDQLIVGRAEHPMSIREFLGDELGVEYYYIHPRNWGRRGIFSIDEPAPTIRSTNRPIPPGYKSHPNDAGPIEKARPLTSYERARLQTFGRDFILTGYAYKQDMMIANAVPVALAEHVARSISRYQEQRFLRCEPDFKQWLGDSFSYTPRTVSNILSRLKRATHLLDTKILRKNPDETFNALKRCDEFNGLTPSVRSQIRKAVRLHADFINSSQVTPT